MAKEQEKKKVRTRKKIVVEPQKKSRDDGKVNTRPPIKPR